MNRTARHQAVLRALDQAVERDVLRDWHQYGVGRSLQFELTATSAAARPPSGLLTLEQAEAFAFGVAAATLAMEAAHPLCRACREEPPGVECDFCDTCVLEGWTSCSECGLPVIYGEHCQHCGHLEDDGLDDDESEPTVTTA